MLGTCAYLLPVVFKIGMLTDEVHELGWGVCFMMLVNQNLVRIFLIIKVP
jgi:hypothetical protein